MGASVERRRSRSSILVGALCVCVVAVVVFRILWHRPAWWDAAGDSSSAAQARGVATENAVVREITRVRGPESWGFVLGDDDVNAWLVNRFDAWSASQGRSFLPEGIEDPRIRFGDGSVEVGVLASQGGAEILALLRVDVVLEDDRLRLDISGGGDGLNAIVTSALLAAFAEDGTSGDGTSNTDLTLPSSIPLTDGRRVVVEDFEIVPGECAVQFRTERP